MEKLNLDDLKALELEILVNFDVFCKKNNLTYFIAYGTLLGAVRHGGFIPWDDDVDVQMPREDYERFLSLRKEYEKLYTTNVVKALGDKGYPFPFIKIENKNTLVHESKMSKRIKTGVWIDVFPVDNFYSFNQKLTKQFDKEKNFIKIIQKSLANPKEIGSTPIRRLLNHLFVPLARIYVYFFKIAKRINNMCNSTYMNDNQYIGTIVWSTYGCKEVFKKTDLYPLSEIMFCGKKFYAPKDPNLYLTQIYGDYMQLPPEDKRETHLVDAWEL